ncbi:hypothetical protein ES319_D02G120900v1 [Gossypium barbadense]|uniref:Uncharacterized protein n=1 Tax=Gossypium barbadense TaxID=3634 RepID=A0A5J5SBI3_GOSBA|nr:hypothetical protein ES319_D02G120900v1 [Gossypium barbadense]
MSNRFYFCKTFSIPFLVSASRFLFISFPPHFLSVHQRQPLLLILGVLLLLGCACYQQALLMSILFSLITVNAATAAGWLLFQNTYHASC